MNGNTFNGSQATREHHANRGAHARIEPSRPSRAASSVLAFVLATSLLPAGALAASAALSNDAFADGAAVSASADSGATDAATGAAASALKDETVYVKAAADGAVEGLYVVNRFAIGDGTVLDPGDYLYVTNLTTSEELSSSAAGVDVPLQQTAPFYYEGALDASTALPWEISLKYWLDGREVSPAELGGATGAVRIELSVAPRTQAAEPGLSDFANAYVLQAQGTFDASTFEVTSREGSMMAQVGGESIVNCMVLPGESATFALEGEANGFASSGWQISALPLSLAIDIAEQDTSALTEATTQLQDATGQLSSGSGQLAAGASSALGGAEELADGASDLTEGSADLQQGTSALSQGMNELAQSSSDLLAGWETLAAGVSAFSEGAASLSEGSSQYEMALQDAEEEMAVGARLYNRAITLYESALERYASNPTEANRASLDQTFQMVILASQASGAQQALQEALEGYGALAEGIGQAQSGVAQLSDGVNELDGYLRQFMDGVNEAAAGANELMQGAASVAEGANRLSDGADELKSGLGSLGAGIDQLSSGAGQLADAVNGMDAKVLDGIQAVIDEKLGADFELHSFVEPSNTQVNSVQFVYVVEGISAGAAATDEGGAAADAPATEEAEEEQGLIDRILEFLKRLFTGE